ncbi:MAG TPA: hypothetical protein VK421_16785 [Pyrinomonadaceae bacterium]|nr:hypothetical protein [Pyrinomonadaceae bacterium]
MAREKDDLGPDAEALRESEIKQGKEINPNRTADLGEAGQHAPGGYYNQQNANETHIDLDEQFPDKKG